MRSYSKIEETALILIIRSRLLHLTHFSAWQTCILEMITDPVIFAISCGTPTICIFGHIKETHWTPPDSKIHLIISPQDRSEKPVIPRINSIIFSDVLAACDLLLQKINKN